jgi:uncharacterized protein (TIGR02246 family)
MTDDERAIGELLRRWMEATREGDVSTVLGLMADDVLFMVPGREPFGKKEFAAQSEALKDVKIDGRSQIEEIKILGDWAYLRTRLEVTMAPGDGGKETRRSGYTLSILRKTAAGAWVLVRDANLLSEQKTA